MDPDTRQQIELILKGTLDSIKTKDMLKIGQLSNFTVHGASTRQDKDSITIAVLVYAISKIYGREYYHRQKGWAGFEKKLQKKLRGALNAIKKKDDGVYENTLKGIFAIIERLDNKMKGYISAVFEKARVNKASRLYEHGISIGRTADLLGVTQYELMDYAGSTFIADSEEARTLDIAERIKVARSLFQ